MSNRRMAALATAAGLVAAGAFGLAIAATTLSEPRGEGMSDRSVERPGAGARGDASTHERGEHRDGYDDRRPAHGRRDDDAARDDERLAGARGPDPSMEASLARLREAGYTDFREFEREHGHFEVDATDARGQRVELRVDAHTGAVIARDDD